MSQTMRSATEQRQAHRPPRPGAREQRRSLLAAVARGACETGRCLLLGMLAPEILVDEDRRPAAQSETRQWS